MKIEIINDRVRIHIKDWMFIGQLIYGKNKYKWKFLCPRCGKVQTAQDFILYIEDVEDCFIKAGHHCLSRYSRKSETNCFWTLDGVLKIHKMELIVPEGDKEHIFPVFEFADAPITDWEKKMIQLFSPLMQDSIMEKQDKELFRMWKELSEGNPEMQKVGKSIFGARWDE